MTLTFRPLDTNSAQAIITWHYEPPYDIYDMDSTNPEDILQYLLDPQNAFHGIYGQTSAMEAFCSFGLDAQVTGGDYSLPALDIGLGIRPDLTGHGRGSEYVKAVIDFASQTFTATLLRVTIAAFNQRAQWVWKKEGFQVVQSFQGGWTSMDFVVMTKSAS